MIILNLKLSNFMNIASADLKFQKGINVLSGKNGQGKSAVFESIAFCLTGRRRGDSWKDYIKSGSTKFTIDLLISNKGQEIQLLYVGEKNAMSLSRTIKVGEVVYTNSECDAFLEDLFDIEMLENVMFTMQDSPSIASMMPGERRAIFKKVFNTDFTDALAKIKEDHEALTFKRINTQADLRSLEAKQYHLPDGRIEVIDESQIEDLREKITATEVRKEWLSETLMKVRKDRSRLEGLLSDNRLSEEPFTLSKKIDQIIWTLSSFDEAKAREEINALHTLRAAQEEILSGLLTEHDSISREILFNQNPNYVAQEKEQSDAIYKTKSELSLILTQIKTSEKKECITCGQECSLDHLTRLISEKKVLEVFLKTLAEAYEKLIAKQKVYTTLKNTEQLQTLRIETLKNDTERLSKEIASKEVTLETRISSQSSLTKEKESLEAELSILLKERRAIDEELSHYQTTRSIQESIDKQYAILEETRKELSELESIQKINMEKQKVIERVKKDKEDDLKKKEEFLVALNSGDQEEKDISSIRQIFEIHLPNYINQRACDVLQSYMTTFLNNSKEDFKVLLQQSKKGIDFLYKATKDSDWLQAKLASGFESALLTLAFKCAVASAYGAELLILDEPDKAATESASAQLFQTITEDLKSGFEQIFIITHRNNSLEYLQENDALIYRVHQGSFEVYE